MIGSLVGAGMKVAGGLIGGITSAAQERKVRKNIENQMKENQDWFDRRYNEDATQRADVQRVLTNLNDTIRQRNKQTAGTQAVMGGTEESVASAKAANNEAIADTTSRIAAAAEARKDDIENIYLANKSRLNQELNANRMQTAQNIAGAVNGVAQAGADIAENWSSIKELAGK